MRENRGEIGLALQHKLPKLIKLEDMKGDLHVHTKHSGDSENRMEDIVNEVRRLGRKYFGATDHSKSEYVSAGLDDRGYIKLFEEIEKVNSKLDEFRILKSGEVDILKDGSLDIQNKTMEQMDYVLAAVHSNMKMNKEEMTGRVVKALESGHVNILAHPTCRLINERDPVQLDMDKIFEVAKENGVVMEIDAIPPRFDLNDENVIKAKEYKLKFSIDTDSHRLTQLQYMRYGIGIAKRAWLRKEDVINTMDVPALLKFFKK
jgi:DNA polymerase (family 10)